jgi:hypothetical protein
MKIALLQMDIKWESPDENLALAESFISKAAEHHEYRMRGQGPGGQDPFRAFLHGLRT